MENQTNSQSSFEGEQGKDKCFKIQLKKVYEAFLEKPRTMKEADACTGIMRENICRHVSTLLEQGKIAVIRRRKCGVTGFPYVNEYTSDETLFPKSNQTKLF